MSAQEKREKNKSIARTIRATQPVCSISVSSWPANSKIADNGMVPPSESWSKAPTGNLAHAQNAVKRLQARRCLIVPRQYKTSYYDVLGPTGVVRQVAHASEPAWQLDSEQASGLNRLRK